MSAASASPSAAALCSFRCGDFTIEVVPAAGAPFGEGDVLAGFAHGGERLVVRAVRDGAAAPDPILQLLTCRERDIVRHVSAGLRNKQIAHELRLSEYTVAAYVKQICYKLQVRNRTAMVTRCSQLMGHPMGDLASQAVRGVIGGA